MVVTVSFFTTSYIPPPNTHKLFLPRFLPTVLIFHVGCSIGSNGWEGKGRSRLFREVHALFTSWTKEVLGLNEMHNAQEGKGGLGGSGADSIWGSKSRSKNLVFHRLWNVVSSSYIISTFFEFLPHVHRVPIKYFTMHIQERTKITWDHMKVWKNKKTVQCRCIWDSAAVYCVSMIGCVCYCSFWAILAFSGYWKSAQKGKQVSTMIIDEMGLGMGMTDDRERRGWEKKVVKKLGGNHSYFVDDLLLRCYCRCMIDNLLVVAIAIRDTSIMASQRQDKIRAHPWVNALSSGITKTRWGIIDDNNVWMRRKERDERRTTTLDAKGRWGSLVVVYNNKKINKGKGMTEMGGSA